ncbi:MAG: hypothetical protein LJE87_00600 [Deltaproteobacteria bacterium]|nr:hypothetical protein [Deltaproteobacteria bacterium]
MSPLPAIDGEQFVIPAKPGSRKNLIKLTFTGFPFDFAQGGEPVEPRISPHEAALVRNDVFGEL